MKKSFLSVVLCVALLLSNVVGLFTVSASGTVDLLAGTITGEGYTYENGVLTVTGGQKITIAVEGDTVANMHHVAMDVDSDVAFEIKIYDANGNNCGFDADFDADGNGILSGLVAGSYGLNVNIQGAWNYWKWDQTAAVTKVEIIPSAAGTLVVNQLVQNDGSYSIVKKMDITSASYEENEKWEATSLIDVDESAWTSVAGGGGDATVAKTETGIAVSANGGWPAAALNDLGLTVDWATAAFRVDYTVLVTGRVQLFYGASDINNYDSKEYVDLSKNNGSDLNTGRYTGTIMVKDIVPESAVAEDGTVTFNSLKVYAIGTGNCINVDVLDVLNVAEPVLGSYENPYQLSVGGRVVAFLEPGAEAYVQVDNANGTIMTAYGANPDLEDAVDGWFVQYGRQSVYPDASATATLEMNSFSNIFSVMNTSETETRTIYLSLAEAPASNNGTFEQGSDVAVEMNNGAYVVVGGEYVTVTDGTEIQNVFVAEQDGTLTFTVYSEQWFYVVNNLTAGTYGDAQWSDSDPVVSTYVIEVAQGDEIQIIINTYDAANPWTAPEGSVEWAIAFEAAACAHDGLIHFEAVEPGCHMNGNIEYWMCPDCEIFWQDEALTQLTNSKNVIVPAVGGEVVHVEAVDASCYQEGNIEHWYCETCEQVWQDEALTQLTNHKNVITPATHTDLVHMDAVAPGCHYEGNIEYWVCYDCETFWQDEALTQVTNSKNVILPATGDEGGVNFLGAEFVGGISEGASFEVVDGKLVFTATAAGQEMALVIPEAVNLNTYPNFEATYEAGMAYDICFNDNNNGKWMFGAGDFCWGFAGGADGASVPLKAGSEDVNFELTGAYKWNPETGAMDAEVPANAVIKQIIFIAKEAGTITISKCAISNGNYSPLVHVEAADATCYENGNIEYWYCGQCEQVWQDEALTQLTNIKNVVVPATHANLVHFDAVEPGCHSMGCVEYWYCPDCEGFWTDEACTQVTNSKSVNLPATGSENLEHVEASCYNVEYWYCPDCEGYWLDEACTMLTNAKSVIRAEAAHELVHFDAVEPGCHSMGCVEYWYCSVCDGFWTDEA
ncbi:MAG: hypothetical protein E7553_06610, partial [Ruminococcaceae bacterium]|nr:hypothetical protein [Oscillospiraceae bacterium]